MIRVALHSHTQAATQTCPHPPAQQQHFGGVWQQGAIVQAQAAVRLAVPLMQAGVPYRHELPILLRLLAKRAPPLPCCSRSLPVLTLPS